MILDYLVVHVDNLRFCPYVQPNRYIGYPYVVFVHMYNLIGYPYVHWLSICRFCPYVQPNWLSICTMVDKSRPYVQPVILGYGHMYAKYQHFSTLLQKIHILSDTY